jgi:hypothetical protein
LESWHNTSFYLGTVPTWLHWTFYVSYHTERLQKKFSVSSKATPSDFSCRVLLSEYGGSARNDWFVSANVDQIRVLPGRSYCRPDLYSIESLWIFDVDKALNLNFHTMGQKFWGFWTIIHSQMTIWRVGTIRLSTSAQSRLGSIGLYVFPSIRKNQRRSFLYLQKQFQVISHVAFCFQNMEEVPVMIGTCQINRIYYNDA